MLNLLGKVLGFTAMVLGVALLFTISGLLTLWTLNTLGAHFLNATAPYTFKTVIASGILYNILRGATRGSDEE